MNFQDIFYNNPKAVYLLLGVFPIAWMFLLLYRHRQQVYEQFAKKDVIKNLVIPHSKGLYIAKSVAICLAWIFATFALMSPHGYGKYPLEMSLAAKQKPESTIERQVKKRMRPHDVILMVDSSASMSVADARSNTTRLEAAKEIAEEIIRNLKGESVSIYAYTSEVIQESPSTLNYLFARLMLRQIGINEGGTEGTDITKTLEFIHKRYLNEETPRKKTVILLSDGGDTKIESLTGSQKEQAINAMLRQLKDVEKSQLSVYTIGVGSRNGRQIPGIVFEGKPVQSSLDEEILKRISQKGQGRYYSSNEFSVLDLATDLVKSIQKNVPTIEEQRIVNASTVDQENLIKNLYYQYPLAVSILFLAIALVLPATKQRSLNEQRA